MKFLCKWTQDVIDLIQKILIFLGKSIFQIIIAKICPTLKAIHTLHISTQPLKRLLPLISSTNNLKFFKIYSIFISSSRCNELRQTLVSEDTRNVQSFCELLIHLSTSLLPEKQGKIPNPIMLLTQIQPTFR